MNTKNIGFYEAIMLCKNLGILRNKTETNIEKHDKVIKSQQGYCQRGLYSEPFCPMKLKSYLHLRAHILISPT